MDPDGASHWRRRAARFGAIGALAGIVVATAGCPRTSSCVGGAIAPEPGRLVVGPGTSFLELRARFTARGKPVAGATLVYIFAFKDAAHRHHELALKEIDTDQDGVAVARLTRDELAVDQRLNGRFEPRYQVNWDHTQRLGSTLYCATSGRSTLPLDQFPPPA